MPRAVRAAARAFGVALSAAGLAFVALRLAEDWPRAQDAFEGGRIAPLPAAVAAAAAGMVLVAIGWRLAIRLLGADLSISRAVALYFRGEIAKYVPGSVWAVIGRGELARRDGVPGPIAYGSVALSLGALYLAAAAAAAMLWPAASDFSGAALAALAVLPAGLLALHPGILGALVRAAGRLLRRPLDIRPPHWGSSVGLAAAYLPAWAAIGTATWLVAVAIGSDASWLRVTFAAALSWLVGFLVVPAPGGLGVREATFVAAAGMPGALAASVALAARVLFMTVDAAGAAVASAASRPDERPRERRPNLEHVEVQGHEPDEASP